MFFTAELPGWTENRVEIMWYIIIMLRLFADQADN